MSTVPAASHEPMVDPHRTPEHRTESVSESTKPMGSDVDDAWPGLHDPTSHSHSFFDSAPHNEHSEGSSYYKYVEPVYESFVCPLSKQVMQDPVALENGRTFERVAIEQWFQECKDKGGPPTCPVTGMELESTALKPSMALQSTIEEWTSRNEVAQIENARIALAYNSSDEDMLHALRDVCTLCTKNNVNQRRIRTAGLIPFIAERLNNEEEVRCAALATLRILSKDDDDNKEAIGETDAIRSCFKSLSCKRSKEKEEAIHLLSELSKYRPVCEKIGAVNGSILRLVGMTSSTSENVFIVEKAEETLDNLEGSDQNMKQMAENGRLQPLLRHLVQGPMFDKFQASKSKKDIWPKHNKGTKLTTCEHCSMSPFKDKLQALIERICKCKLASTRLSCSACSLVVESLESHDCHNFL